MTAAANLRLPNFILTRDKGRDLKQQGRDRNKTFAASRADQELPLVGHQHGLKSWCFLPKLWRRYLARLDLTEVIINTTQ